MNEKRSTIITKAKVFIAVYLVLQMGYNWYSSDVTALKATRYINGWTESILADADPKDEQDMALAEIKAKANALCDVPGVCDTTLAQMER